MTQHKTDIVVVGSGMAGLSFAALAAQKGFKITVIDRVSPEVLATDAHDPRTVALSVGTREILAPLGIWDDIVSKAAPISSIDVQEGHDPFVLNFEAGQSETDAFGWIFPNAVVRQALHEKAVSLGVKFIAPAILKDIRQQENKATVILQSDEEITAQLIVGADGRQSRVRDLIGVPVINIDYHHVALVGLVEHELPHQGLAVERFYPSGPFAILPFVDDQKGSHRSAIVWSQDSKKSRPVLPALDQITENLKPLFDERYGEIKAVSKWAQYPLQLTHAKQYVVDRVVLISDAAHGIHPIAGQGLNLGMRDVSVLVEELGNNDIDAALANYQTRRRFDVFAMIAATDLLNRLFSNKYKSIAKLRSLGLGLVNNLPPLKRFFANAAMGK